jgi:hypothetical protein
MSSTRTPVTLPFTLPLAAALAFVLGCGNSSTPWPADPADASATGSGSGGGGGNAANGGAGAGGTGGTTGVGTGGTVGSGGGTGGAASGQGGVGGIGTVLDGGLGGLVDAAVTACPADPDGKSCGAAGMPFLCTQPGDGGVDCCLCLQQKWVCPNRPGGAGIDASFPMLPPRTACADNAAGTTCPMLGGICTRGAADAGAGGCLCLPGTGNALSWRCTP